MRLRVTGALFAALVCVASVSAAEVIRIDIEPGGTDYSLHQGGELSAKAPITGEASALGDSRGKYRQWFEFFTTQAGLIEPGFQYTATFKYRVEFAAPDAFMYALYRSEGKGWGTHDRGWTNVRNLHEQVGEVQTATISAGLANLADYELMVGINGDARLVVDDVTITRGEPFSEPTPAERAIAKIPADAKTVVQFDFATKPEQARLFEVATLTTDPEQALDENGSLLANSVGQEDEWANVLWLPSPQSMDAAEPLFAPGYAYHVQLRYRVLEKADAKAAPYMLFRSKEHGAGNHDLGWQQWSIAEGDEGYVYSRVEILEGDDYYFSLGIQNGAKVVIDDLVIKQEKVTRRPIADRVAMTPSPENLVWEDTFDGSTLDESRWVAVGPEPRRGGYWLPEMATLDGKGNLALKFDRYNDTFAMAAIETQGKIDFKYGYFEARMKLPEEAGHWPGFWLFSPAVNRVGNDGRDGTEIDIMEAPYRTDHVSHALHWDGYGDEHRMQVRKIPVEGVHEGWHTFAVEWSPDGYIFFVNGQETWRTAAGGVCEVPLYIILSDEQGGWSGDPEKATKLPDFTYVDYVRVYQTDEWREADEARRQRSAEAAEAKAAEAAEAAE